jgi:CRP-like cAMP-binding protein
MNTDGQFSGLKPKLVPCEIKVGDHKAVVKSDKLDAHLVLPKNYAEFIPLFNGENSIQDIVAKMYENEGQVSFNSIIKAIHLLQGAGLLEEMETKMADFKSSKAPHEQAQPFLIKHLFQISLFRNLHFPYKNDILFLITAVCFIAVLFTPGGYSFWDIKLGSFLKYNNHYHQAFLKFAIMTSTLISLKAFLKYILLSFSVGDVYKTYLRFNLYSISFAVDESAMYTHNKKSIIIIYSIFSALAYFTLVKVFSLIMPGSIYLRDLSIIATLLTFIELDPYRKSEFSKIFSFFYNQEQLNSMLPYIKNCSLSSSMNVKDDQMAEDIRFTLYSSLSFIWAIVFILFSMNLMSENLGSLFFALQLEPTEGKISAGLMIGFLLIVFAHLSYDLLNTLLKNIYGPIKNTLNKKTNHAKVVEQTSFDESDIRKLFKENLYFSCVSDKTANYIINNAKIKSLKSGQNLITQGVVGTEFFILLSGTVEVNIKDDMGLEKRIVDLGANTVIGEMALLEECKRTANVIANEEIMFLEFDKAMIQNLSNNNEYKDDLRKIIQRVELSQFVSYAGLFNDFPPEVMNLFVEAGDMVIFPKDSDIVTEGENDKTFFLLIRGSVDIVKGGNKVASLGQGDFFGEIALIANTPRTASAHTLEDTLVLYIEHKNFWNILSNNIELAMYIESIGEGRINSNQEQDDEENEEEVQAA